MLMAGEQMTGISSSCVTVVKDWFVISFSEGDVGQWSGVGNLPFLWVVAIGASCGISERGVASLAAAFQRCSRRADTDRFGYLVRPDPP